MMLSMENEIINKVDQSGLLQIDPEQYYVAGERELLDLTPWLFENVILKEKIFREHIQTHNWSFYKDKFVAITCTADAIIPAWAYMIVAAHLSPYAKDFVFGDLNRLEEYLFMKQLAKIDLNAFQDQRVVIKGCSDLQVPLSAYVEITKLLQPVAKSVMYGEPCSTVPVFKKK